MAIVLEDVLAHVVFRVILGESHAIDFDLAKVDVVATHDGDAPQVVFEVVVAHFKVHALAGVVDGDAAAAVVCVIVAHVAVVGHLVAADDGFADSALDVDAVAAAVDLVVLDEHIHVAREAHQIGHRNATHHVHGGVAVQHIATHDDGVAGGEVEHRHIAVHLLAVVEGAVFDAYQGALDVGSTRDGGIFVVVEETVGCYDRRTRHTYGNRATHAVLIDVLRECAVIEVEAIGFIGLQAHIFEGDVLEVDHSVGLAELKLIRLGAVISTGDGGFRYRKAGVAIDDAGNLVGQFQDGIVVELELVAIGYDETVRKGIDITFGCDA